LCLFISFEKIKPVYSIDPNCIYEFDFHVRDIQKVG